MEKLYNSLARKFYLLFETSMTSNRTIIRLASTSRQVRGRKVGDLRSRHNEAPDSFEGSDGASRQTDLLRATSFHPFPNLKVSETHLGPTSHTLLIIINQLDECESFISVSPEFKIPA